MIYIIRSSEGITVESDDPAMVGAPIMVLETFQNMKALYPRNVTVIYERGGTAFHAFRADDTIRATDIVKVGS